MGTLLTRFAGSLVHDSIRGDVIAAARHESFVVSHLVGGIIALVATLVWIAWAGLPEPLILAALAWLTAPAAVAVVAWRTGRLATAHLLSACSLAGAVGCVAAATGGIASFAAAWIIVVPAEAALSGSRRVIAAALVVSCATVAILVGLDAMDLLPIPHAVEGLPFVPALGIASALAYVGGLALSVERLHALAAAVVARSEERYRLMAENASDLITRHDADGNVVDVAGATTLLLGDRSDVAMGRRLFELVHLADRPSVHLTLQATARTGEPSSVEFRLACRYRKDEFAGPGYRWVELRCRRIAPSPGRSGDPELIAVTRDITTSKAQQMTLLDAKDEAERANRAKSHFLAKISHELRTPLNAIIGFSEILQDELAALPGHERRMEYARLIHQSGAHLLDVVSDLLDMSKLEAGKMDVRPAPFHLVEVVDGCIQVLRPLAERAQVSIQCTFPQPQIEIVADRRACRQIMFNLLSNAIKFTPSGGRINVAVTAEADMVVIVVEDDGIGIAADALPRIGNPFYQVENGYDRKREGTGLGLSVVKGLAELHGGAMCIESRSGEGTRATVRLPRVAVDVLRRGAVTDAAVELRHIA